MDTLRRMADNPWHEMTPVERRVAIALIWLAVAAVFVIGPLLQFR